MSGRPGRLLLILSLAGLFGWSAAPPAVGASSTQDAPLQDRVRAAFLYNFARFTQWPANAPGTEFEICVLQSTPLAPALAETLAGKDIHGRPAHLRMIASPAEGADCRMIYLPDQGQAQHRAWLQALGELPVLTVGEGRDFVSQGGMIGFHLVDHRLRFAINPDAVYRAGMRMSSQLLSLADIEGGGR